MKPKLAVQFKSVQMSGISAEQITITVQFSELNSAEHSALKMAVQFK